MREAWNNADWFERLLFLSFTVVIVGVIFVIVAAATSGSITFLSEYDQRMADIERCMATERYTREECILIVTSDDE